MSGSLRSGRRLSQPAFVLQNRHEPQVAIRSVALGGVAHQALIDESEALVEMAGPGVVLVDIEEEPVSVKLLEGDADQFFENPAAQTALRSADHDPLQLDCAT